MDGIRGDYGVLGDWFYLGILGVAKGFRLLGEIIRHVQDRVLQGAEDRDGEFCRRERHANVCF